MHRATKEQAEHQIININFSEVSIRTHSSDQNIIMTTGAPTDQYDQLLVDFPTRRQPTVRFASTVEVLPIRSTLTMICHKEELWSTNRDFKTMKLQRRSDAIDLGRILLAPSAEDLMEGGVHVSQAVGLRRK